MPRCKKGTHKNKEGNCVPKESKQISRCKKGTHKNKEGNCVSKESKQISRCKKGTHKNKEGNCVSKDSSKKRTRTSSRSSQDWNSDVDKEFNDILKNLREGKLKKMDFNQNAMFDCKSCLNKFSTTELQNELDSRKKQEQHINILVPRKKNQ